MPTWKKWTLGLGIPIGAVGAVGAGIVAVPALATGLGITSAGPVAGGAFAAC